MSCELWGVVVVTILPLRWWRAVSCRRLAVVVLVVLLRCVVLVAILSLRVWWWWGWWVAGGGPPLVGHLAGVVVPIVTTVVVGREVVVRHGHRTDELRTLEVVIPVKEVARERKWKKACGLGVGVTATSTPCPFASSDLEVPPKRCGFLIPLLTLDCPTLPG